MAFFEQAITVLQTLVIALGAGLGIWEMCIRDRSRTDKERYASVKKSI